MITVSVCLSLVILAFIAAIFSLQHNDWVLDTDRHRFVPPFFKSEGFWRAFLINLSFAGISTAAGAVQHVRYIAFWMWHDPFLAILVNLGFGLIAALVLSAASTEIQAPVRRRWTAAMVIAGFTCFAFAVGVTSKIAGPKSFGPESQQLSVRCTRLPPDDDKLKQWLGTQLDAKAPDVKRDGLVILIEYERDEALLGPSEQELRGMGYEGAVRVEPDYSTRPLTWWLRNMPGLLWAILAGIVICGTAAVITLVYYLRRQPAPPGP